MTNTKFLTGPAGSGKTTQGVERLLSLIKEGVSPYHILVLLPQRTLDAPYRQALQVAGELVSGPVEIVTTDGLAQRAITLFWPQIAQRAGFGHPDRPPIFLNIEAVQHYMAEVIEPFLRQGYFDPNVVSVTITLPRLMSQILDNLEKAALIDIDHTEVGARLKAALGTEISSRVAFEHAQDIVNAFRDFCLRHNLLDFSLRVETFRDFVWTAPDLRQLLVDRYRHLIVDNLEEHNPFTHSILAEWLPQVESALLIYDEDAGYRIFLGANSHTAESLQEKCDTTERMADFHVAGPDVMALGRQVGLSLGIEAEAEPNLEEADPRQAFTFNQTRFHPQMITWAVDQVQRLIKAEGVSPGEIVVLAPFVSDALRFSFMNQMERRGLPVRSHRPSRALKEEPAAVAALTLARLIHPEWNLQPEPFDVMQALTLVIDDLDLVRARLLTDVLYRPFDHEQGPLFPFEAIEGEVRERITYQVGSRYDTLRRWIGDEAQRRDIPLDHTFSRLFGEVLSQPGFGFHRSQEAGEIIANLIDSIRNFRRTAAQVPISRPKLGQPDQIEEVPPDLDTLNRAYVRLIEQGIVAALYTRSWDPGPEQAVLIAPAYTYLMSNRPVDYQIWLDAGSEGWWERIAQPLTHPYVLSANWEADRPWTDQEEVKSQIDRMHRLVLGLTRRCRKHVFITNSEIGERGYEQRGRLLLALQQTLRRLERTKPAIRE